MCPAFEYHPMLKALLLSISTFVGKPYNFAALAAQSAWHTYCWPDLSCSRAAGSEIVLMKATQERPSLQRVPLSSINEASLRTSTVGC